ncbi:hypothetical protein [Vibrio sonorensis]|uniref:hypothetical protein n=1 Tax=Vibrio sonorensis TaxID=1004316 RepID=UPI0008DB271F|nr:hypothetical protein [Vibrio sonorensis]
MTSNQKLTPVRLNHYRINFTHRHEDSHKAMSSVRHSLRIALSQTKKLEWLTEFESSNLIWLPAFGILNFERMTTKDRESLARFIAPKPRLTNKIRWQKKLSDAKRKLKKALNTEQGQGHDKIAMVLSALINHARDEQIKLDLKRVEKLDMMRKSQRMNTLERYIEAHNRLADEPRNENAVYVQEGILKIPHKWGISTDIISEEEYVNITKDFLLHYFPDYRIKAIVLHHDERLWDEVIGRYKTTGAHTHYYLSGMNTQSGEYDLNRAQIQVVEAYMKEKGVSETILSKDTDISKLTREQTRLFGKYFQKMLYEYVNTHLLNPKGFNAEFAPETERQSTQRKKMNEQARLPKMLREYNLLQMNTDRAQKHFSALEHRMKFLKRVVANTEDKAAHQLASVLKDVYVRTYCMQNSLDKQAADYLLKVTKVVEEHLSIEMKSMLHEVAVELDDKDLAYRLKPSA